ncbi:MAG: hypothetical protein ABSE77_12060 [Acidimicrobiales bacterium]
MRTARPAASASRLLLGACLVVAATSVAASPAWARSPRLPVPTTSAYGTTTTTTEAQSLVPSAPPPASPDTCVPGAWPAVAEGRPATFLAGSDGAYLWHDPDGGWALRVTHTGPQDRVIFSGSLTTSGKFVGVQLIGGGGNDIVVVGLAKHTIFFRFVNYGLVDGLDFATHCSRAFTVKIYLEGQLASPGTVHLGQSTGNPTSNPFQIERTRGESGNLEVLPTTTVPAPQPTTSSTTSTS